MICEVADMEATCEEEDEGQGHLWFGTIIFKISVKYFHACLLFWLFLDFNRIKIILGRRRRRDIVRIVSKESGDSVGGSDAHVASSITFDFIVRGKPALKDWSHLKTIVLQRINDSFDASAYILYGVYNLCTCVFFTLPWFSLSVI